MDNGVFGVPMSSGMASILANDPVYAPQRAAAGTAQPAPVMRPSQAALALADSIRGGAKPGANTIMRTINQSESPDASREAIGQAMGDQIRKSATTSRDAFGNDNAFMPRSHQNSVRMQKGY
jgi:hypothetical protein